MKITSQRLSLQLLIRVYDATCLNATIDRSFGWVNADRYGGVV